MGIKISIGAIKNRFDIAEKHEMEATFRVCRFSNRNPSHISSSENENIGLHKATFRITGS